MPGKHAPSSPWSFYASVARATVVGVIGLGLIIAIVMVTLGSNGDRTVAEPPSPAPSTVTPTTSGSPDPTVSSPSAVPSPVPTGPPGFQSSISVLNGTERNGLAARIRARLVDEGYLKVTSGNAEPTDRTVVYYRGDSREAAEEIVRLVPELGDPVPAQEDTPAGAVVIVLGSDFQG